MAISGLHIGLIAGIFYLLANASWRRIPRLSGHYPAQVAGAVTASVAGMGYALLAGFTLPTQRAVIMLLVVVIATLTRREVKPGNSLALALILVLLRDPQSGLSAGFWLSFCAVATLLVVSSRDEADGRKLWKWVRIQFAITLVLFPVLRYWQIGASLISPMVNLWAIPLFGFLLVPLALAGGLSLMVWPALGEFCLGWCAGMISAVLQLLAYLADLAPTGWLSIQLSFIAMISSLAGAALLYSRSRFPFTRLMALVMIVPGFAPSGSRAVEENQFRFTLLDVGQGLSAVVQTHAHTLVYDTGPRFRSGFNTADAVVIPFLRYHGTDRIDTLMVSHGDNDHAGGTPILDRTLAVEKILGGEPGRLAGVVSSPCRGGQKWHWDGVEFEVLYPPPGSKYDGNDASCVLRIGNTTGSVLLTGDIEKAAENWLLENHKDGLRATVVVAPHHGSKSSSSADFIAASEAKFVLFPAGFANRWGFPKKSVEDRWVKQGAKPYTTARSGSISLLFSSGEPLRLFEYRSDALRYWHHRQ